MQNQIPYTLVNDSEIGIDNQGPTTFGYLVTVIVALAIGLASVVVQYI
jgi:hypothetical protein